MAAAPSTRAPLELVEETNWFFRLSRYADVVREAIETGRLRIVHDGAREETLAFLRGPVRDISVSRSAIRARGWGLPVLGGPVAGHLGVVRRTLRLPRGAWLRRHRARAPRSLLVE
jgi:methionyl-tRNA synthetase